MRYKLKEFNISGGGIPPDIADKIFWYHMLHGDAMSEDLGVKVYPSLRSCYRPLWWEKKQGRSGTSEHTFIGKGACDWTMDDYDPNILLESLINNTDYMRMAVYKTFIHADYKPTRSGKREIYNSNWIRQEIL